jgi:putative transport protein
MFQQTNDFRRLVVHAWKWLGLGLLAYLLLVAAQPILGQAQTPAAAGPPVAEPGPWEVASQVLHQQPLVLCFLVIALGMGLGSFRIAGLSLGTSGVLFSALLFGHFGQQEDWAMPEMVGKLGLVLFVYAVGLGAGPTFFRTFRDQGKQLALLGVVTVVAGGITAWAAARILQIPGELATGIFSGAMTSTPALAAGLQAAQEAGGASQSVSIGYGMAYPMGVIAVVVFVQLLPRLLRVNLEVLGRELQLQIRSKNRIGRYLVRIANPAVYGKTLHEVPLLDRVSGQITRKLEHGQLVPVRPDHVFEEGQVILLVTDDKSADMLTMMMGERANETVVIDSDRDRADVVITSPELIGRPLRDLHLRTRFGVTISRIERYGVDFVPNANSTFANADRVTAVGEPEGLQAFETAAGHRIRKLHETDLMSVGMGLVVGIVLGMIPIPIPGVGQFTLGLAGGPLLAGLLFAHFGRFMGIVGYMPLAARMLTQEIGLAFFLAAAGFDAGGEFAAMLRQFGATPFVMSLVVAVIPMTIAVFCARFVLQMDLMQTLGGICGSMTSTAGIGAIVNKTDCDIPVASYAAAYPAALVMMTILAQVLIAVFR